MKLTVTMTITAEAESSNPLERLEVVATQPQWDLVAVEMAREVESKLQHQRFRASAIMQAVARHNGRQS